MLILILRQNHLFLRILNYHLAHMPKLKTLSGKEVVSILCDAGFFIAGQKGSHIKLKRILVNRITQTLTVPNHDELDKGTLKVIYNQALRYIPEENLRKHFYTE